MTKEEFLNLDAEFIWGWGDEFFLETDVGNFIWSDPDYRGDNTIRPTSQSYGQWIDPHNNGSFGRAKGVHNVRAYCGEDIILTDFPTQEIKDG